MAIQWASNSLHFHLDKLFKKGVVIWHYFVWQLFWLLFKKLGDFSKSSGHPAHHPMVKGSIIVNVACDGKGYSSFSIKMTNSPSFTDILTTSLGSMSFRQVTFKNDDTQLNGFL
jgi:hypothetical protein